jgi:septal ring factor EnvC (AmiA/AmiB activator)
MKKPLPTKSISDLRKEHEIAQLQQTIRSLRAELHMERSRRQLAEAQVEYLSRNVDDLKTDVAEWQQRYSELLDISESMQRTLYIYEEHAGSEEDVRIDAHIAELMDMTDNSG